MVRRATVEADTSTKSRDNDVILTKRGRLVEHYQAIAAWTGGQQGRKPRFFAPRRSSCLLWANGARPHCHPGARARPGDIWRALDPGKRCGSGVAKPRCRPK